MKGVAEKVLVVDDEPKWIGFLEEQGGAGANFELVFATGESLTPNILEGVSLALVSSRQLDTIPQLGDIPIVVATGEPDMDEQIRSWRVAPQNVVDYVPKDFRDGVVFGRLETAMAHWEKMQNQRE